MTKLPEKKQMEFAGHFAARFPTLAGKKEPPPQRIEATAKALDNVTGVSSATKAFVATEFVTLGIPYAKPVIEKPEDLSYPMRAGNRTFEVTGHPKVGLPYGNDYLAAIFLDTAYQMLGCPDNRVITFRSSYDVVRFLRLLPGEDWKWRPDGRLIKSILGSFDRMAYATFYGKDAGTVFDNRTNEEMGELRYFERYQLISRYKLWVDTKEHPNQHTLDFKDGKRQPGQDPWPNAVELDWRHAANLEKGHSAPIDMDFLRGLLRDARTPHLPRFGLWQRWRSHSLTLGRGKETVVVPIFGDGGLVKQFEIAADGPDYKNSIRRALRRWHARVKEEWPTCPNVLTKDELLIHPQKGPKLVPDPRLMKCIERYDGEDVAKLFRKDADRRVKVVNVTPARPATKVENPVD